MTINDLLAFLSDDYRQKLEAKKKKNELLKEERRKSLMEFYKGNFISPGTDSEPYPLHDQLLDARPKLREQLHKPAFPVNQWQMERFGIPLDSLPHNKPRKETI